MNKGKLISGWAPRVQTHRRRSELGLGQHPRYFYFGRLREGQTSACVAIRGPFHRQATVPRWRSRRQDKGQPRQPRAGSACMIFNPDDGRHRRKPSASRSALSFFLQARLVPPEPAGPMVRRPRQASNPRPPVHHRGESANTRVKGAPRTLLRTSAGVAPRRRGFFVNF